MSADDDLRAALTEGEYAALPPGRIQAIADQLSEGLPGGLRFDWAPAEGPLTEEDVAELKERWTQVRERPPVLLTPLQ